MDGGADSDFDSLGQCDLLGEVAAEPGCAAGLSNDGREIVSRKLSGVVRLFWMLLVPFSTIYLFQHWFHGFGWTFAT